jgi:4-diphosphocytidyl-2-C-methyl-D-erythritol kinase
VRPADEISLSIEGSFAPALADEPDNLVLKAARALAAAAGISDGAAIELTKRLPVAGGIGGGSADAAAVLQALAMLWKIDPDALDLAGLAMDLGADVPVCLAGRAAYMSGAGERLDPAPPLPPAALVLANPMRKLSTKAVFDAFGGRFTAADRFERSPADARELAGLLAVRRNDLTEPARQCLPEIGAVLEALNAAPGALIARMSGSGATCFALFEGAQQAERAAAEIASAHPEWWVRAARLVEDIGGL